MVQASAVPRGPSRRLARLTWVDLMTAPIVSPVRVRQETHKGRSDTRKGRIREKREDKRTTSKYRRRKEGTATPKHRMRKAAKELLQGAASGRMARSEEPDELAAAAGAEQSGEAAPEGETAETLHSVKRARNEE